MGRNETNFNTRFSFDKVEKTEASICVVGVGGGGGNAVDNMILKGIPGVDFLSINTDVQALASNRAPIVIQAGRKLTRGMGAGARPSIGAEAMLENKLEIEEALGGYDMVFITAGMGGGTGTGGAPVAGKIVRSLGILSVAVVTKPFLFEGPRRLRAAEEGIDLLRNQVDTLVVISNERLLENTHETTRLVDAFAIADDVLYNAIRSISDLVVLNGLINLDFADIRTTIRDGGLSLIGSGAAKGDGRAERAARAALTSPLMEGCDISGARNVLVNITSGPDLGFMETHRAATIVQQQAGDDAEVIFGSVIDESLSNELRVTIIATGFEKWERSEKGNARNSRGAMPSEREPGARVQRLRPEDVDEMRRQILDGKNPVPFLSKMLD
jgi:cell division protein FtsZ